MNCKCSKCQQVFEVSPESSIGYCPNCGETINLDQSVNHVDNNIRPQKSVCPVCSTEIQPGEEMVICPDCKIAYHKDCWNDNNGCATYGCKQVGCLNPPPIKVNIPTEGPISPPNQSPILSFPPAGTFECPHCHTKMTAGTKVCWSCGKKIVNTVKVNNSVAPGAWTRWLARQIDLTLEICFLSFVLGVIGALIGIDLGRINDNIITIIVAPFALILDSIVYAILGNTLGKWLMGIIVIKETGIKVNGGEYLKRNMRVYWGGLGLCIPIVVLCTAITQYNRVTKKQETTYDELLQMKSIRHNANSIKTFFGVCLFIIMLFGLIAINID